MVKNEFKKVCIKNRTCYCFNDIIKFKDIDFDNILIDEKSQENILIYDISYKTLIGPKPLRIRFDKIDGFIIISDGTRYLVLFGSEKYDGIYNRIKYFMDLESNVTCFFLTITRKSKQILIKSLPIEKRLILHNVLILIKCILNKYQNHYCYNIIESIS